MNGKKLSLIGLAGCSLLLIVFLVSLVGIFAKSIVYIGPDERGVVLSPFEKSGILPGVLTPGRNLVRPWESVVVYKISHQVYTTQSNEPGLDSIRAKASGGEEVLVDVSATYVVDPVRVHDLHIHWQDRYPEGFVRPSVRQTTRTLLSQYTLNEIMVDRRRVEMAIFEALRISFAENYLILLEFQILDIQSYE